MKIAITGAHGFIGKNIIPILKEMNYEIDVLARSSKKIYDDVEYFQVNFQNQDSLIDSIEDADVLLHMGGLTKSLKNQEFYNINYGNTKNIIDVCKQYNPNIHFIFISSQAASGYAKSFSLPKNENDIENPVSHYGMSKLKAENYIKNSGINYTILRLASVFGPGDFDGLNLFKMGKNGIVVSLGREDDQINYIYVKELPYIINDVISNELSKNNVFNIGYKKSIKVIDLIKKITIKLEKKRKPLYIKLPLFVGYFFAFFLDIGQKITKKVSIINLEKIKEISKKYWVIDCSKLYNVLNYKELYTEEQFLNETIKWYKKRDLL